MVGGNGKLLAPAPKWGGKAANGHKSSDDGTITQQYRKLGVVFLLRNKMRREGDGETNMPDQEHSSAATRKR